MDVELDDLLFYAFAILYILYILAMLFWAGLLLLGVVPHV